MKARFIGVFILIFLTLNIFSSNPGDPKYKVIIDTDGAIDDMRSITMFLAAKDVQVLAITCSQGTLKSETIYSKVKSLLVDLNCEDIPVAIDENLDVELPVWAPFAEKIEWGKAKYDSSTNGMKNADELLNDIFEKFSGTITLVALGTLKTYADWVNDNQQYISRIERIIWYNNIKIEDGFNYQVCPESFDAIKQIDIKLDVVGNSSDRFLVDQNYLSTLQNANSLYAKQIIEVHKQPEIVERIEMKHLKLWDDFVPLYLTAPILFDSQREGNISYVVVDESYDVGFIYERISMFLKSRC